MSEGSAASRAKALGQNSWAFYEWARNPIWIVVAIYIFGPYFSSQVVGDPVRGQALWGTINAVAGIVIAVLAPFLGAMADRVGKRKPWIISMTLFMAGAGFVLWYALPNNGGIGILGAGLAMIVISVAFEFSAVFHNSMLPTIARDNKLASLSGLGLALGNLASLIVLVFMLITIMLPGSGV
ncbi:MAG: MFS transporter, partial [Parvibaculaceae bacterium]|nr:MFS transporter [Parvibaculaceae bacterium]